MVIYNSEFEDATGNRAASYVCGLPANYPTSLCRMARALALDSKQALYKAWGLGFSPGSACACALNATVADQSGCLPLRCVAAHLAGVMHRVGAAYPLCRLPSLSDAAQASHVPYVSLVVWYAPLEAELVSQRLPSYHCHCGSPMPPQSCKLEKE